MPDEGPMSDEDMERVNNLSEIVGEQLRQVVSAFFEEQKTHPDAKPTLLLEAIALALARTTAATLTFEICCREHYKGMVVAQAKNILLMGETYFDLREQVETRH